MVIHMRGGFSDRRRLPLQRQSDEDVDVFFSRLVGEATDCLLGKRHGELLGCIRCEDGPDGFPQGEQISESRAWAIKTSNRSAN